MFTIKYCQACRDNGKFKEEFHMEWEPVQGYFIAFSPKDDICPYCKNPIYDTGMTYENDYQYIAQISDDPDFFVAMADLKQKDPIEYQLKLSQFKTQLSQQDAVKQQEQESERVRCPKCGSTNITAGQRGYSFLTGFLGSGSTVNRCANCGYKWKPGK